MLTKETVNTLKIGDILLYRPHGSDDTVGQILANLSFGKYAHASCYTGYGRIIESHFKGGVVELPLEERWHPFIDVYRPNFLFNDIELLAWLMRHIGAGYDRPALPSTFWGNITAHIYRFLGLRRYKPLFNNPNSFYCSELITTAYAVQGRNICPGVNYMSCTPSDLAKSKVLSQIY